ncbi:hypothetical protein CRUP_019320 [Coryphaenoides rupestris]|nr:hypothetical protein CRUP_019320 [Coryphaenoides rupestris]
MGTDIDHVIWLTPDREINSNPSGRSLACGSDWIVRREAIRCVRPSPLSCGAVTAAVKRWPGTIALEQHTERLSSRR